jgi:hypothetical protein
VYSPADIAFRPRNAEPARRHFLPASLASLVESPSTSSGWASCLRYQILLLLSRHPAFHGRSQSLYIASPNHPAACGTWSRLVVPRWQPCSQNVPVAANPRTGSACTCRRAYSLHAINSFLLPPVSPVVDSSAIHPLHNQPCSTASHRRCWPPAGHTAASLPRLLTTLTGAPFRSTTIYIYLFPQSQPSSRFPSHLLIAHHPLHS